MSRFDNDSEFWADEYLNHLEESGGKVDREVLIGWFKIAMLSAANRVPIKAPSLKCSIMRDGETMMTNLVPIGVFYRNGEYRMETYDLDENTHKEYNLLDMNFVAEACPERLYILQMSISDSVMDGDPPNWDVVEKMVSEGYLRETYEDTLTEDSIPLIKYQITQKGLGYLRQNRHYVPLDNGLVAA